VASCFSSSVQLLCVLSNAYLTPYEYINTLYEVGERSCDYTIDRCTHTVYSAISVANNDHYCELMKVNKSNTQLPIDARYTKINK